MRYAGKPEQQRHLQGSQDSRDAARSNRGRSTIDGDDQVASYPMRALPQFEKKRAESSQRQLREHSGA